MRKVLLAGGLLAFPVMVNVGQVTANASTAQHDLRLHKIEQFFADRDCPLRDSAADFLEAADRNALDWRLLPSISMVESSGGKDYRNNNVFGWDSCRESFTSVGQGIHYVASQLANSKRYKNKNLDGKLRTYNSNPEYSHRVKAFMRVMDPGEIRLVAVNNENTAPFGRGSEVSRADSVPVYKQRLLRSLKHRETEIQAAEHDDCNQQNQSPAHHPFFVRNRFVLVNPNLIVEAIKH